MDIRRVCMSALLVAGIGFSSDAFGSQRWISAADYLRENGIVRFPTHPTANTNPKKNNRDTHQIGDTKEFWSWDLSVMPPKDVLVPATCRAVGANSYIFVADDQWGSHVSQQDVDNMLAALESQTPVGSINSNQGIILNEIEVFGAVPDTLDNDPHVYLLLMELKRYGGTQFDGFFNAYNQLTDQEAVDVYGYHSNEIEMITVNSAIRSPSSDMTLSILAHEFAHLIQWGADADEVAWISESCSEAAMVLNGYYTDIEWMNDYLNNPQTPLYQTQQVNYGVCLLFGSYLYERFGSAFLNALVADSGHGETGLIHVLDSLQPTLNIQSLLLDWATATVADGLGAQELIYQHPLLEVGLPKTSYTIGLYPLTTPKKGNIAQSGTTYLKFGRPADALADVRISLVPASAQDLWARGIMVDTAGVSSVRDFVGGEIDLPFAAHPEQTEAYVVLMAPPGKAVSYEVTAVAVAIATGEPDAGVDGGPDSEPNSQEAVDIDGGTDASPDASVSDTDHSDSVTFDNEDDNDNPSNNEKGCGCGSSSAISLLGLFLIFGLFACARFRKA